MPHFDHKDPHPPRTRYRVRIKTVEGRGVAVPQFGKACVCCNMPTVERLDARIGNSDLFHVSGPIKLPTCPDCKFHVHWRHMLLDKVIGIGGAFGWILLVLFLTGQSIGDLKYGALILVPWTAYILYTFVFSRRMGGPSHHAGIEIYVSERGLDLRTSNRELVERVVAEMEMRRDVEVRVEPALSRD